MEDDETTVTLTTDTLTPGQTYTLHVEDVRTKADLTQKISGSVSFTVEDDAPVVENVEVIGVGGGTSTILITFNEKLGEAGTAAQYNVDKDTEDVTFDEVGTGATLSNDDVAVTLTIGADLTVDGTYELTVANDVADVFGNVIEEDTVVEFTFAADDNAPVVTNVYQDTEADEQVVNIEFDKVVDGTNAAFEGIIFDAEGLQIDQTTYTFEIDNSNTATITIDETDYVLEEGTQYTLRITDSDIVDGFGNEFDTSSAVVKTFVAIDKVAPYPTVITKVDSETVTIQFNENIVEEEELAFDVDGQTNLTYSIAGDTITLSHNDEDGFGTDVITAISGTTGEIADTNGNVLDMNTSLTINFVATLAAADIVDEAAPQYDSFTADPTTAQTITLSFSEAIADFGAITDADEIAEVLSVENGSSLTITGIEGTGGDLVITFNNIDAATTYYIQFVDGQEVVKDNADNLFDDTSVITVTP